MKNILLFDIMMLLSNNHHTQKEARYNLQEIYGNKPIVMERTIKI